MEKYFIKKLKELKKLGVSSVKHSTEDEGASFNDITLMRKITSQAGIKLNIKIGGCEAKNDIFFCKRIKVNSIIAPMVESDYALKKFIQCIPKKNKKILLYVNIETQLAVRNLKKILSLKEFNNISGIVIGRSDVAGSIGQNKEYVNSKEVFKICKKSFNLIKKKCRRKIVFKMGGGITSLSKKFVKDLYEMKLLNYIETRNIEIKLSKKVIQNFDTILHKAFAFEKEILKNRISFLHKVDQDLCKDYQKRILEIDKRIN